MIDHIIRTGLIVNNEYLANIEGDNDIPSEKIFLKNIDAAKGKEKNKVKLGMHLIGHHCVTNIDFNENRIYDFFTGIQKGIPIH